MSETKIDIGDDLSFKNLLDSLVSETTIKLKIYTKAEDNPLNHKIFNILMKTDTELILQEDIETSPTIIRLDISNPSQNKEEIIYLEKIQELELEEGLLETETFETEDIEQVSLISEWDRLYDEDKILESLTNQINIIYKNKLDIYDVYSNARSIIDLVNKYKITDKEDPNKVFVHGEKYQPLLQPLLDKQFNGTNIYPIIYDSKKFYTTETSLKNLDELVGDTETIRHPDYKFKDFKEELKILINLIQKYHNTSYKKKSKGPGFWEQKLGVKRLPIETDFLDYKNLLQILYEGGTYVNPEDLTELIIDPVLRPYINSLEGIDRHYFKFTLEQDLNVYRAKNDNKSDIFKYNLINPEDKDMGEKNTLDTRIAEGPIYLIEDQFSDLYLTDAKGKHNRIITCNGTNKTGDRFYLGADKTTDINKSINSYPKNIEVVSGETVNMVGLYIKAIDTENYSIITGNQYIKDDRKMYPQINNIGTNIGDISSSCVNNNEVIIIDNYLHFDIKKYDPSKNYIVYFNSSKENEITADNYYSILKHILPNVRDIIQIEKTQIEKCSNITQLSKIFSKYGMNINNINTRNFRNLINSLSNRVNLIEDFDKWFYKKYLESKKTIKIHDEMYNGINDIKYNIELIVSTTSQYDSQDKSTLIDVFQTKLSSYFKQFSLKNIKSFVIDYLKIKDLSHEKEYSFTYLIEQIFDHFNNKSFFNISEISKYFVNPNLLVEKEYLQLLIEYTNILNIPIDIKQNNKFLLFDYEILRQIDFINSLKKSKNNGKDIIDIINISNCHRLKNITESILEEYGKNKYFKTTKNNDWETLDISIKQKYIPTRESIHELSDEKKEIINQFIIESEKYNSYIKNCNGIKIIKEYVSESDLIQDNNKTIYYDNKYDTTFYDVEQFLKWEKNNGKELSDSSVKEKLKLLYPYDDTTEIDNKLKNIKSNIENIKGRIINNGEIALLKENGETKLYRRHGNIWLALTEEIINTVDKCYNYDRDFLNMSFEQIYNYCTDLSHVESVDKLLIDEGKCIEYEDKKLPARIYKIYEYINLLDNRINDIAIIIKFLDENSDFISSKLDNLKRNIHILKGKTEIKNKDIESTKKDLKDTSMPYQKVLPSKNLRDELNNIKKESDFDLMAQKLNNYIEKYGSSTCKNKEILKLNPSEGVSVMSKWYYYNISSITEPLICKHYELLMTARYKSNTEKNAIFETVRDKWGKEDGEYYFCKNCGEIVGFVKYSDWEGFGKNDKAIMVREVIEDDEEEIDIDRLTENTSLFVKQVIRSMSSLCNIKLTNDDFMMIITTFNELENNEVFKSRDFNDFFDNILLQSKAKKGFKKLKQMLEDKQLDINEQNILSIKASIQDPMVKALTERIQIYTLGYKLYMSAKLIISIFIEIYRTGIPDYPSCVTGVERHSKKTVLSDHYYNEDLSIEKFIDIFYTQIDNIDYKKALVLQQKGTKLGAFTLIKGLINDIYGKGQKDEFTKIVNENIKILKNYESIRIREDSKAEYKNLQKVLKELELEEINKQYEWNDFIPNLGFITKTEYYNPNINSQIGTIKTLLYKLNTINTQIDDPAFKESLDKMKSERKQIIDNYQNEVKKLKDIQTKLSFSLITKINKINFEEKQNIDTYARRWQSYTSSLGYDSISKNYFDFYIERDNSIRNDLQNLEKINIALADTVNQDVNKNYVILNKTTEYKDLQNFMKFDRTLYKSDDEIKSQLINKLKAINYIYVQEGTNIGKKRIFKDIQDLDYNKLIEIYTRFPEIDTTDKEIERLLKEKLGEENYDTKELELKMKLILNHNGLGEIDVVNMEFKKDISENVDKIVLGKTESQINELIVDFETKSAQIINKNKFSIKEEIKNYNNHDLIKTRLYEVISNYYRIFKSDDEMRDIDIQDITNKFYSAQISKSSQLAISTLIGEHLQGTDISTNIKLLAQIIEKEFTNLTANNVIEKLNKLCDLDNYFEELDINTDKLIKIELGNKIEESELGKESKFRKTINTEMKYSNIIHIEISILRNIVQIFNSFYNSLFNDKTYYINSIQKYYNQAQKNKQLILSKILESKINFFSEIITELTSKYGESIGDRINIEPEIFEKINKFIESLTFYNHFIDIDGTVNTSFVNNPKLFVVLINRVILYLMISFLDTGSIVTSRDIDEDFNTLMSPLFSNIYEYIVDTCHINNLLEDKIDENIKKQRAGENENRKKRFDKLDEEQKDLQRLFRKSNLGKHFDFEEGHETSQSELEEGNLMSTDELIEGVPEGQLDEDFEEGPQIEISVGGDMLAPGEIDVLHDGDGEHEEMMD